MPSSQLRNRTSGRDNQLGQEDRSGVDVRRRRTPARDGVAVGSRQAFGRLARRWGRPRAREADRTGQVVSESTRSASDLVRGHPAAV